MYNYYKVMVAPYWCSMYVSLLITITVTQDTVRRTGTLCYSCTTPTDFLSYADGSCFR